MSEEKKKFCRHCGSENDSDAVFCTECGKDIEGNKSPASQLATNHHNDRFITLLQNKKILGLIGIVAIALVAFFFLNQFELKGNYVYEESFGTKQEINIKGNKTTELIIHAPMVGDITFEFKLTETDNRDPETNQVIYEIDKDHDVDIEYDMSEAAIREAGMDGELSEMISDYGMNRKETKDRVIITGSYSSDHPAVSEMIDSGLSFYQSENGDLIAGGDTFTKQ